jgi:putative CocE/NonD family hydrolase
MSLFTKVMSRLLKLPPATHPDVVQQADLAMTTSDGAVLLAHRWYPRGHESGLPTLLMRSPYGRRGVMAFEAALLAERGYNVVVQSTRGTHGSGGDFYPFRHEAADGVEALRWVHQQPWCDGRVATFGGSYCGYTQHAMAAHAEPGLIAASTVGVTSADLRCLFKPYGAFTLASAGRWVHGLDPSGRRTALQSLRHGLAGGKARDLAARHLPLRETDVVLTGEKQPFYEDWVDSALDSPYFDDLDVSAAHARQTSPTTLHAGWFDIFAPGQLDDATALFETGRAVRLVVGPWHHAAGMAPRFRDQLAFFDQVLRGRSGGRDERPVRVQLYGDKRWWAFSGWPVPSEPRVLHVGSDGRLSLEAPEEPGRVEWVDDPEDPAPTPGGAVLMGGGPRDNAPREARDDVRVFTSAPLTEDLVILGSPRFVARADADVPSYDVAVRLCVVDEKGVSRNISDGMQRVDGGEADVAITMWPAGARVLRGQRIRLQVAGSLHPLWARNLHTGEDSGSGTTTRRARQALVLEPGRPALVELPVVRLTAADLATDQT